MLVVYYRYYLTSKKNLTCEISASNFDQKRKMRILRAGKIA